MFLSQSSPVPQIKWRKVDGSQASRWISTEPVLQFQEASFDDEGTYECEAENGQGKDTFKGRLIIQGKEPEQIHLQVTTFSLLYFLNLLKLPYIYLLKHICLTLTKTAS